MRVAVFEALPSGGARRVLDDVMASVPSSWACEHFTVGSRSSIGQPIGERGPSTVVRRPSLLDRLGFGGAFLGSVVAQRRIARLIDAKSFDVAIVNHDAVTHTPALLAALRTPSVFICHEPRRSLFEFSARRRARAAQGAGRRLAQLAAEPVIRACEERWAREATAVLANSQYSAESIVRAYGVAPDVWHLGVDPDVFRPVDVHVDRPYLLSVGAMDPLKGHHHAVEALGRLAVHDRPELHVVGGRGLRSYADDLSRLAAERGVALRVHLGASDTELVRLYSGAIATLALGVLEPFGLTTIESMACGTPVIGIREGGYREVVLDGVNGILVPRSAQHLAHAIEDTQRAGSFSPAAVRRSVLPYWSTESAAGRLATLVTAVLEVTPGRRDVIGVDNGGG